MSEAEKKLKLFLEIALNPIGSLGLRERLEGNKDSLIATFHIVSSSAVDLTLSPNGYRIIECFLNANIDSINDGLAESLSVEWNELKKVLKTVKGRYVCETLLDRGLKAFAHKIIIISPRNWWFKNEQGPRALHVLIKAIAISESKIANDFCCDKQTEEDLCNSPEGLYCLLKVKGKSMDQPGWKEELKKFVLLNARSTLGSKALEQVIVYGDYLSHEITEIICGRRESYDDCTTVSLIIRLVEVGSTKLKQHLFKLLCGPPGNPLICRIRNSSRFDDFRRACDSHFTFQQRDQLDSYLASTSRESIRDDSVKTVSSINAPPLSMVTTPTTGLSKKRRMEQQSVEPSQSITKKSKEGVNNSDSPISISPSSMNPPTGQGIPSSSTASPSLPSTLAMSTSDPFSQVSPSNLSSLVVPPPILPSIPDTVSRISHSPLSNTSMKPSSAVGAVVKVDSPDAAHTKATRPTRLSSNSTNITPVSTRKSGGTGGNVDPGDDVLSMAMSDKSRMLVSKLESCSVDLRQTIFGCIQNGLLALMMDERGYEIVKWFIKNGYPVHKEIIEMRVKMNVDDLVESGGYGSAMVKEVIEECTNPVTRKLLNDKYEKAMRSLRVFSSTSLIEKTNDEDEIEIVSENLKEKEKEKFQSGIPKARNGSVSTGKKSGNKPGERRSSIVRDPPRIISAIYATELRDKFNEVVAKLMSKTAKTADLSDFVNSSVVVWFMKEPHTRSSLRDLISESISNWLDTKKGLTFLKVLTLKSDLRLLLNSTVASVLHHLIGSEGERVLDLMLTYKTAHLFVKNCLEGDDSSFFMTMLSSDMETSECVKIGVAMARASEMVMSNFLARMGGVVAETEKGRAFMALLASPQPVGFNWTELFKFLPPPSTITAAPSVSSINETISPRFTPLSLPDRFENSMDGTSSLLPDSSKSKNTMDGSRPSTLHRLSSRKDLSPQSSSISISPSHPSSIPSFPFILHPPFPNPRLPTSQSSISAILAERIVKETVDFIVTSVVEQYPSIH